MSAKAKIGVLGASGYTGAELVRMLLRHPRCEIVLLTAERSAGKAMRDIFPQFSPFALPQLVAVDGLDWGKIALDVARGVAGFGCRAARCGPATGIAAAAARRAARFAQIGEQVGRLGFCCLSHARF